MAWSIHTTTCAPIRKETKPRPRLIGSTGLPTSRRSSISTPVIPTLTPYCSKARHTSTHPWANAIQALVHRAATERIRFVPRIFGRKWQPYLSTISRESVAVVVDGNMAQAFARDCAHAGMHDEPLVLSWPTEGGETVSRVWRPWEDADENSMGFCVNAFELPQRCPPSHSDQNGTGHSHRQPSLSWRGRRWRASRMDLTAGFWKAKRSRTTTSMSATEASSRSAAMQAEAS